MSSFIVFQFHVEHPPSPKFKNRQAIAFQRPRLYCCCCKLWITRDNYIIYRSFLGTSHPLTHRTRQTGDAFCLTGSDETRRYSRIQDWFDRDATLYALADGETDVAKTTGRERVFIVHTLQMDGDGSKIASDFLKKSLVTLREWWLPSRLGRQKMTIIIALAIQNYSLGTGTFKLQRNRTIIIIIIMGYLHRLRIEPRQARFVEI